MGLNIVDMKGAFPLYTDPNHVYFSLILLRNLTGPSPPLKPKVPYSTKVGTNSKEPKKV